MFSSGYYLTLQGGGQNPDIFMSYKGHVLDSDANSNSKIAEVFERKLLDIDLVIHTNYQ